MTSAILTRCCTVMLDTQTLVDPHALASLLRWWGAAGVDTLVEDEAHDWLARPLAVAPPIVSTPAIEQAPTRDALVAQLTDDKSVPAGPVARRIAASGNPTAPLMVLIDIPEAQDHANGQLLSGEAGVLFDRMLAAIGITRETCYVAALCPGRPASGFVPQASLPQLTALARRHIALVAPQRLWLMGKEASRAILAMDEVSARGSLRNFNHDGVNVECVVSYSPSMLLASPHLKREAWADMQILVKGMTA